MSQRNVTILGATGSIGVNTLDVIARHPTRFRVFALTAATRWQQLAAQCEKFSPRYAVMTDPDAAERLRAALKLTSPETEVKCGADALERVAAHTDVEVVMAAIVGAAGLKSSLAAAHAGKTVLLANKESLVMAGRLFMDAILHSQATLLPIDSEHNAIFQCLPQNRGAGLGDLGVHKIVLTASGGPFRTRSRESLVNVTPDEACAHPNWVMGRKISVDSATMMNKGLEVIEAHWLFNAPAEMIEVVLHPQSVIHSMVSYCDGSVIAQMGNPDMRTPIAYGLAYPERIDAGVAALDLADIARLEFAALDLERFPCVSLAFAALNAGGTAPAILNAANEIAVEAFLGGKLPFTAIPTVIERVTQRLAATAINTLDDVMIADATARAEAEIAAREVVTENLRRVG